MVEELIDKNNLLERIKLQHGIYGMTVDEVIGFIKQETVRDSSFGLQVENVELEDRIGELEDIINNVKSAVDGL
jgi:hypothetical protein